VSGLPWEARPADRAPDKVGAVRRLRAAREGAFTPDWSAISDATGVPVPELQRMWKAMRPNAPGVRLPPPMPDPATAPVDARDHLEDVAVATAAPRILCEVEGCGKWFSAHGMGGHMKGHQRRGEAPPPPVAQSRAQTPPPAPVAPPVACVVALPLPPRRRLRLVDRARMLWHLTTPPGDQP
jgi:hypothetical protein